MIDPLVALIAMPMVKHFGLRAVLGYLIAGIVMGLQSSDASGSCGFFQTGYLRESRSMQDR